MALAGLRNEMKECLFPFREDDEDVGVLLHIFFYAQIFESILEVEGY